MGAGEVFGSGSKGVVTRQNRAYFRPKIAPKYDPESICRTIPRPPDASFPGHSPIDARKKIGQLRRRNRHHAVRNRRPKKPATLQPFREQTSTLAVMPDNLKKIASGVRGKRKDRRRGDHASASPAQAAQASRIPSSYPCGPSPARHERRSEKRSSLGELRSSGRSPVSAPITLASVVASGAPSIVMRTLAPNAIMIAADAGRRGSGIAGATVTGTKAGRRLATPPIAAPTIKQAPINASLRRSPWHSRPAPSKPRPTFLFRARPATAPFDRVMTSIRFMAL